MASGGTDRPNGDDIRQLDQSLQAKLNIHQYVDSGGVQGLDSYFDEQVNEFMRTSVNMAIIGQTSVGKTTLINTLRGLRPGDRGAALAGPFQENRSTEMTRYRFRGLPNVCLWDEPGHGTPDFAQDDYWEQLGLHRFDSFIIMTRGTLLKTDLEFVKHIHKQRKIIYFLHNRIDEMIMDGQEIGFSENYILTKTRRDIEAMLSMYREPTINVYLISARYNNINKWDFNQFVFDLATAPLRDEKRRAMVFALVCCSSNVIAAKVAELRENIGRVCQLARDYFNKKGVKQNEVLGMFSQEVRNYRTCLGVTEMEVEEVRDALNQEHAEIVEELREKINRSWWEFFLSIFSSKDVARETFFEKVDRAEKKLRETLDHCERLAMYVLELKLARERLPPTAPSQ